MTETQIKEILQGSDIKANIKALKVKQVTVRNWADLEQEYDPTKHPITDSSRYKEPKQEGDRKISLRRITLSEQKLAASLMTGYCVGVPVFRNYEMPKNEVGEVEQKYKDGKNLIEAVYKGAMINEENIERIRLLFSTCQIATVWYSKPESTIYAGKPYPNTIGCKTYAADTCDLWPQFDRHDNLIGLCIEFKRKEGEDNVTYFDIYSKNGIRNYMKIGDLEWQDTTEKDRDINVISVAYTYRPTPIWEDTSEATFAKEEMFTYTNFYIRQNSDPKEVYIGDDRTISEIKTKLEEAREKGIPYSVAVRQIFMETGSNFYYAQYQGATASVEFMTQQLREEQNRCLQLFDHSQKSISNISTETFLLMMGIAELKVKEEAGRLIRFFKNEEKAVRGHVYAMVTKDEKAILEMIKIDHEIIPFSISDISREIQQNANAVNAGIKSRRRAIAELYPGEEDVIMKEIEEETSKDQNMGLDEIGI